MDDLTFDIPQISLTVPWWTYLTAGILAVYAMVAPAVGVAAARRYRDAGDFDWARRGALTGVAWPPFLAYWFGRHALALTVGSLILVVGIAWGLLYVVFGWHTERVVRWLVMPPDVAATPKDDHDVTGRAA